MLKRLIVPLSALLLLGAPAALWAGSKEPSHPAPPDWNPKDGIDPLDLKNFMQRLMDADKPPQVRSAPAPDPAGTAKTNSLSLLKTEGFYGSEEDIPCGFRLATDPANRRAVIEAVQNPFRAQDDCPALNQAALVTCPEDGVSLCRVGDDGAGFGVLSDRMFILWGSPIPANSGLSFGGIVYHYAAQAQLAVEDESLGGPQEPSASEVCRGLKDRLKDRALKLCGERGFDSCVVVESAVLKALDAGDGAGGYCRARVTVEGKVSGEPVPRP